MSTPTSRPFGSLNVVSPQMAVPAPAIVDQEAIRVQRENAIAPNTRKAYLPRIKEWEEYREAIYPGHGDSDCDRQDHDRHAVQPEKLLKFLFYQCMREKKEGKDRNKSCSFDREDYLRVITEYGDWLCLIRNDPTDPKLESMPHPIKPLKADSICIYRSAIQWWHEGHQRTNALGITWKQIWGPSHEYLITMVKRRTPKAKNEEYVETLLDFTYFEQEHHFSNMEATMWNRGTNGMRSACTWLRHRYCLLHSTNGILRCESISKAVLSDCMMLKADAVPHPMMILIQQRANGRSHAEGGKLYGRLMRHKKVLSCGVGAFAMYLALRFYVTSEFEVDKNDKGTIDNKNYHDDDKNNRKFRLSDWFNNRKWFDAKILVDAYSTKRDWTVQIQSDLYPKAVKSVLDELKLPPCFLVRLDRKIGEHDLERLEAESSQIAKVGHLEHSATGVIEERHCGVLPVSFLLRRAGFKNTHTCSHHNTRQAIQVPEPLLHATPFAFCYEADRYMKKEMERWDENRPRPYAATRFLDLMHQLNVIFLQDMATIWVTEPERRSHPIYRLPVFQMTEWGAFLWLVRTTLATQAEGVERHVPGLRDELAGRSQRIDQLSERMNMMIEQLIQNSTLDLVQTVVEAMARALNEFPRRPALPLPQTRTKQSATTTVTPPARAIAMPMPRYHTLSQLWRDWLDRLEHMDVNVPGWRSSYTPAEREHYLRVRQVARGIKEYLKRHNSPPEQLMADLDKQFKQLKSALPRMVAWFRREGYL